MRRSVFLILAFFFITFFAFSHGQSFAQEAVVETETPVGIDTATMSASTNSGRIVYELPYPGMLPDHPLYFLKVVRDGIVKLLINDNVKRARFSLLSAEKRVYAGKLLVDKKKDKLAVETIAKGNNYMEDAIKAIETVEKQTPNSTEIQPFLLQFKSAALKYREIIQDIKPLIDEKEREAFSIEEKRIDEFVKTAEILLAAKQ